MPRRPHQRHTRRRRYNFRLLLRWPEMLLRALIQALFAAPLRTQLA
jgi:hypothetical protein